MGVITIALIGVAVWAIRYAQRSKAVVEILQNADTPEARKEALAKLESGFKKDDTAAIFAKAQLEMQEDPRKALATLEQINLAKVMATVADEARAQRAMIHLILGETDEARALVDKIDLSRQSEVKARATLSAIVAEAFARSGDAKRAVELLDKFDLADDAFADLKPQLLRAKAFAYAWANNTKQMRRVLQELKGLNVQYLMGFVTKKKHPGGVSPRGVHPMLEKEAFDLVMKSGMVQRRMEMRRG
jgi:tetratricopeptide (TPR) repeat protein